jgi:hypothetical protein
MVSVQFIEDIVLCIDDASDACLYSLRKLWLRLCVLHGGGLQVSLLAAANLPEQSTSPPGSSSVSSGQPFTIPTAGMAAAAPRRPQQQQQQQQKLAPGAIAGIVIGSVAGAALLAAAGVFGYKKTKRHRWAGLAAA